MSELKMVKSEMFGEVQADIYTKDEDLFMTIDQLAQCLEYSSRNGVEKIISRAPYLKEAEFSTTDILSVVEGGRVVNRERRLFNEDGIYEVTMLSGQPKAKDFRGWVRMTLKAVRRGKAKVISMTDYQKMMAQTRAENIRVRKAQILTKLAEEYEGTTYQQVLNSYATKELTGEHLLPLPQLPERTYTATEVGEELGISANKVGVLSNRHNLKIDQYGEWFKDKAKGCNKEVPAFRYYANVIPVLRDILEHGEKLGA